MLRIFYANYPEENFFFLTHNKLWKEAENKRKQLKEYIYIYIYKYKSN